MEAPDYDKLMSVDQIETEIDTRKDSVCRKLKMQLSIKDQKKETNRAYNEQIKEIQEEIDHELGVIDALKSRLQVVQHASG